MGAGHAIEGHGRLRRAPRQLGSLRLAGVGWLQLQHAGVAARLVGLRRQSRRPLATTRSRRQRRTELRHAYVWGRPASTTTARSRSVSRTSRNIKVRGAGLSDYAVTITGAYNFGIVRPALACTNASTTTRRRGDLKRDFWGVSATAPIGPGALYAFWGDASDGKGGRSGRRARRRPDEGLADRARTSGKSATRIRCRSARRSTPATSSCDNDRNAALHVQHQRVHDQHDVYRCWRTGRQNCGGNGKPRWPRARHDPPVLSSTQRARLRQSPGKPTERAPSGARFVSCARERRPPVPCAMLDSLIIGFDRALRTLAGTRRQRASARRARELPESRARRRASAATPRA